MERRKEEYKIIISGFKMYVSNVTLSSSKCERTLRKFAYEENSILRLAQDDVRNRKMSMWELVKKGES